MNKGPRRTLSERFWSLLTAEAVRVIRAEWPRSSARQLGDRFGVTESNVLHVVHGRTWSHVKTAA